MEVIGQFRLVPSDAHMNKWVFTLHVNRPFDLNLYNMKLYMYLSVKMSSVANGYLHIVVIVFLRYI